MLIGYRIRGLLLAALSSAMAIASPASATIYQLKWAGTVQTIEGDAGGSGIKIGDAINAAFQFDDSTASSPSMLSIGGGTYSIYGAPLSGLSLAIGAYVETYPLCAGSLTYMDNSFGSDGIVFGLDGLPGGPFGSTFANIQFQARGPVTAIDSGGLTNGLPYNLLTPSFFAVFGNGTTAERIYGTLTVTSVTPVPEPATWTMILLGFGVAGGILRRRSKAAAGMLRPIPGAHKIQPRGWRPKGSPRT